MSQQTKELLEEAGAVCQDIGRHMQSPDISINGLSLLALSLGSIKDTVETCKRVMINERDRSSMEAEIND